MELLELLFRYTLTHTSIKFQWKLLENWRKNSIREDVGKCLSLSIFRDFLSLIIMLTVMMNMRSWKWKWFQFVFFFSFLAGFYLVDRFQSFSRLWLISTPITDHWSLINSSISETGKCPIVIYTKNLFNKTIKLLVKFNDFIKEIIKNRMEKT